MDKSMPYNKIITTSIFLKTNDAKENTEKILSMVIDMLKNYNK